jgi:DNA repair protein RecO (recombination protein O)
VNPRVTDEPAFILHSYPWSESSLILEAWSRHHGRVALVAKGVKKPTSQFRPVLLPLQPLRLSWGGDAEVRTLKAAHWPGGHVMPTGEALLSGYYLNELLMRLLVRDDPHETLFDHYTSAVRGLAEAAESQQAVLRSFELLLLRELGWLPGLDTLGHSAQPLSADTPYVLMPEGGLREALDGEAQALRGDIWQGLQLALDGPAPFDDTLLACQPGLNALRPQLRTLLHYHSGVRVFKTRQMVLDVQALSVPAVLPAALPAADHPQARSE